jgi:DNA polymerase (family 10)
MPDLPAELGAIAAVPGLGPKRVKLIYDHLRVRTLEELRRAAQDGRLRDIRGVGIAVEKKVLAALSRPQQVRRFDLPAADAEARALIALLGEGLKEGHLTIAGSFRRRRRTIGDLNILVAGQNASVVGDRLVRGESVAENLVRGPTRTTVVLRSGLQVELRAVPEESYGAALLYYTGSKEHNVALRALAGVRGWKLNEYGLFAGKRRIAGATEEELYGKLGLEFVPPELREDRGEIALAKSSRLPHLVSVADIRGDLHVQCNWTKGGAAIAPIVSAARSRGYEYAAIVDRSRSLTAAGTPDPGKLADRVSEIDRLNEASNGFTLLKGLEVDILPDGGLDLPDDVLARFDVVVAAVHSRFDLSSAQQTERIIRAVRHPRVSIVAHPADHSPEQSGAYAADFPRIVAAAREAGCAIEISADPRRLDPGEAAMLVAKDATFSICSHADAPDALGAIAFGVDQARRAWATPRDVINTRPLWEVGALLRRR